MMQSCKGDKGRGKACDSFEAKCLTEKAMYSTELTSMLQTSGTLEDQLFLGTQQLHLTEGVIEMLLSGYRTLSYLEKQCKATHYFPSELILTLSGNTSVATQL